MNLRTTTLIFAIAAIALGCQPNKKEGAQAASLTEEKEQLNIIFLIGDGMGLSQISSVFYFPADNTATNFTRFKQIGVMDVRSAKQKITDSAAGATAFANGKRSYNGAVGVDVDSNAIENITELLSKQGYQTGVISTSSITHATPACFYAHVPLRSMETDIASQLPSSSIDFFAGGGYDFFSETWTDLTSKFEIDTNSLDSMSFEADKRYGYLLAPKGMPKMSEGRGDFLPKATGKALDYFGQKDDPFFLMIEGSQIDWGGHANDGEYIISELHDFDKAMGVAMDFAEKHGNTLVIVTADHETGGFSLSPKPKEEGLGYSYTEVTTTFTTGSHTSTLIPVFTYGPGSDKFEGFFDNSDVFHKILAAARE